ncbi:MAG: penicillin-binding protein [Deltaproteobacteria bacterium]|nr:penicillin-binding protein [Deltaproteobacteria bacterium]
MFRSRAQGINWVGVRILVVALIFAFATGLLVVRAYRLQVVDAERLQKKAAKQRTRALQVEARRGMILDRSGEQMAASLEVQSIYARPRRVQDKPRTAAILAQTLEMTEESVMQRLNEDRPFVWIRRSVPPLSAERVQEANLKGVFGVSEYRRFYPLKSLAAHAIGFAGIDSTGLEGLELYYDKDLKAEPVPITSERDALGRPILFAALTEGPERRDLHLTLDRNIQYLAEKQIEEAVVKYRARGAIAVVMDADSGELLALAVHPTYNLNLFHKAPAEVRRNRCVADTFEPGSTFKVFLAAAALDMGRVKPSDVFDCRNGAYRYRGAVIHDVTPHKKLSLEEIITHSSNIGMVQVSEELKKTEFHRFLTGFGFGASSSTDLPGERPGLLPPPGKWSVLTKANIGFGQGISVNAMQMVAGFAAVINGGYLYRPYLMKKIATPVGETIAETQPKPIRSVIHPSTSETMVRILRRVILSGTGKNADIPGVEVIGKTGTAQKIDPEGGYSKDRYLASFIGALNGMKPRPVIFVMIDEPAGKRHSGGEVAAPVFRKIAEGIVALCGKEPTEINPLVAAAGSSTPEDAKIAGSRVRVRPGSGSGEWVLPDLKGLTARQVLDVCETIKCDASFQGSGVAVRQNPAAGAPFKEGQTLEVAFEG